MATVTKSADVKTYSSNNNSKGFFFMFGVGFANYIKFRYTCSVKAWDVGLWERERELNKNRWQDLIFKVAYQSASEIDFVMPSLKEKRTLHLLLKTNCHKQLAWWRDNEPPSFYRSQAIIFKLAINVNDQQDQCWKYSSLTFLKRQQTHPMLFWTKTVLFS